MISSLSLLALPLLSTASSPAAAAALHARHDHEHAVARHLPGATWYQRDDHPVHALFKRASTGATDGVTYAAVGSSQWTQGYPEGFVTPKTVPQAWTDALNDATAKNLIPKIPVATVDTSGADGSGVPTYPSGNDANGPEVCSASAQCRIPGDIWDGPDGTLGLSFDDGPTPASDDLSAYLFSQNQTATHFMIGSNIIQSPKEFLTTFNQGNDIAVHTWSHPYMTTMTNEQVVAELGWTMELIHNSTGGRVPRFWRPPFGDSDTRTRAIAKEVFGLTTVIWNQDTDDWSLTDSPPGTSLSKINASMTKWLTGPKTPGLIILEHELSNQSVASFKAAYPLMKANDWQVVSLAQLVGNGTAYQNAQNSGSAVTPVVNIVDAKNVSIAPSSSAATTSASGTAPSQTASAPSESPSTKPNGALLASRTSSAGVAIAVIFGLFLCV
ncbi:Carbohydrate esterase family 4 protein [Mycena kentingensis (nom. inval.)]|nr:Carbohydrate esterase family 4 protein [Mycena kentingensis (nom. inval.)]